MSKIKKIKMQITLHTEQSEYVDSMLGVSVPIMDKAREKEVECQETDLYSEGELEIHEDGSMVLSYDESELPDTPFSQTSLHFKKSAPLLVTLMRSGQFKSAMVFEPMTRHICVYETPFMPIEMCIDTQNLENTLSETGGELCVRYSIETNCMRCERAKIKLLASPM